MKIEKHNSIIIIDERIIENRYRTLKLIKKIFKNSQIMVLVFNGDHSYFERESKKLRRKVPHIKIKPIYNKDYFFADTKCYSYVRDITSCEHLAILGAFQGYSIIMLKKHYVYQYKLNIFSIIPLFFLLRKKYKGHISREVSNYREDIDI